MMVAKILARPVAWIVAGAIIFCLVGLTLHSCNKARQASTEANLATEVGKASAANGNDAVNSVGGAASRDAGTDQVTRENTDVIRNAEGADAPINPAVRNAGLDSLCRRAAYRCTEQCLQRDPTGGLAGASTRCAASRK